MTRNGRRSALLGIAWGCAGCIAPTLPHTSEPHALAVEWTSLSDLQGGPLRALSAVARDGRLLVAGEAIGDLNGVAEPQPGALMIESEGLQILPQTRYRMRSPRVFSAGDRIILVWGEPAEPSEPATNIEVMHSLVTRIRVAHFGDNGWEDPLTVAEDSGGLWWGEAMGTAIRTEEGAIYVVVATRRFGAGQGLRIARLVAGTVTKSAIPIANPTPYLGAVYDSGSLWILHGTGVTAGAPAAVWLVRWGADGETSRNVLEHLDEGELTSAVIHANALGYHLIWGQSEANSPWTVKLRHTIVRTQSSASLGKLSTVAVPKAAQNVRVQASQSDTEFLITFTYPDEGMGKLGAVPVCDERVKAWVPFKPALSVLHYTTTPEGTLVASIRDEIGLFYLYSVTFPRPIWPIC